jgi:predicted DNA-binding ArsR family transcriptional regulator
MMHTKAIEDVSDLVSLFRAFDTNLKAMVYEYLLNEQRSESEIKKEFGKEGLGAVKFFEKNKLVESRWGPILGEKKPEKIYRAYYSRFYIKTTAHYNQLAQSAFVTCMDQKEFSRIEDKIYKLAGKEDSHESEITKKLKLNHFQLRNLVNRSSKLISKGMRIEKIEE